MVCLVFGFDLQQAISVVYRVQLCEEGVVPRIKYLKVWMGGMVFVSRKRRT